MRHPTKIDSLKKLRQLNVPFGSVLDVGVKTCTRELIEVFPDKPHLLMEPIVEWNDGMHKNYSRSRIDYEIINAAISDSDGEVTLRTNSVYNNQPISHARMTDDDGEGPNFRKVPMLSLDSIVAARSLPKPYLLKIDVDGAELSVLAGAKTVLEDTNAVVIETGITNIVERAAAVQSAGFQPFDIVDISYYDDRFVQADMVFLSYKAIEKHGLGVYKDGFDIKKWKSYAPR